MDVLVEESTSSSALSPEQRASIAYWGGEESLHSALNIVQLDIKSTLTAEYLRYVVEGILQNHAILHADICRESGFRGLRMQVREHSKPLHWMLIDEHAVNDLEKTIPALTRGQQVNAALVNKQDGHFTLILAISALLADRGSMITLARQIAEAGLNKRDREALFQYSQYMRWREDLVGDADAASGREYWEVYRDRVESLHAPRLVYRQSGIRLPAQKCLTLQQVISAADMARARSAATTANVTMEVLLQTVWWALLARLTGYNQYVAGWQHDCRCDYEVMWGAVGAFEKVLPLVIEGSADDTFSEWLLRIAGRTEEHIQMQEYCPIDTWVSAEHLLVGFTYHDNLLTNRFAPFNVVSLPGPMPCFELALAIDISTDDAINLSLHADAALYSKAAAKCLLEQYLMLLRGVLEQPDRPVSEIPWLSESAEHTLRTYWQGPIIDFGLSSLSQHISHWAKATPDAPALVDNKQRLDYAELDVRSSRLAHWMRARGIAERELVALDLPRSRDLIVAILATWKIGAGYLPLEPAWPPERTKAVVTDADPALVLCTAQGTEDGERPTVAMADIDLEGFSIDPPAYEPKPSDVAYVLYTSGSTGQPKGVVIEQRQLLNYVAAATFAMQLEGCRCWGLVSSTAADLGNTALFGALYNGACLAIADESETRDALAFGHFISKYAVDSLKIVPSHLEALLDGGMLKLPNTLVLGGEAPSRSLLERIALLAPEGVIYNHYGPTETTVGVMVHRVGSIEAEPETSPLSNVLANNCVYVLDANRLPVPVGAQGELHVSGAQVCRGYLNKAMDDVLVASPWQSEQRLYPTGDLAWVLPDGGIRLAGRTDQQVKIRGFRVEPADVASAILAMPEVQHAAVIARTVGAEVELVAFIESNVIETADTAVLRQHAARYLPEHMRPTRFVQLAALPRLHNGKVDRLALTAMASVSVDQVEHRGTTPNSPLEAVLATYMADLLKRECIPVDADFFAMGGHSLLVIRLVARIRKLFQLEIEPGLIFDYPTPQALAVALCAIGCSEQLNSIAQDAQGQGQARPEE